MPPQKRSFSSKKIDSETKKKIVKKKKTTPKAKKKATPKPAVIKPIAIKPIVMRKKLRKPIKKKVIKKVVRNEKEIENFLDDIYENKKEKSGMNRIEMKKKHPILKFLFTLIFLGGFFATIAWVGFFTFPGNQTFEEDSIKLSIEGPKYVDLGATTTYRINYSNLQKNNLNEVTLTIKYPDGFSLIEAKPKSNNNEWDLNVLKPKEEGYIEITGKMYGSLKQEQSLRVFLNYSPENFESELQSVATLTNKIDKTPFKLSMTGPDSIVVGNDVNYKFILEMNSEILGQELELIPQFPDNFYITNSEPKLNQNNRWLITDKDTTSTEKIQEFTITGKYSETEDNKIITSAELELYIDTNQIYSISKTDMNSVLSKNDLGFNLAINGTTKDFSTLPDELLTISLRIKNSSKEDFTNAKIKLWLDAPAISKQSLLNWSKITDDNDGDIQGIQLTDSYRRGQLVWNKRHIPALETIEAGDEVVVDISLPIKNSKEIDLSKLEDYIINIASEISFEKGETEKVISSNPINITINSDLSFTTKDTVTKEDGEEIHNISWILNNNFHELKDIKLSADIYGDITWLETEETQPGELTYNENDKKITWLIEEMSLESDKLSLPFKIKMNAKNPSQEILISQVHIEATDSSTEETLSFMGDGIEL